MKKIITIIIIVTLVLLGIGANASFVGKTNNKTNEILDEYEIFDEEEDVKSIFGLGGPIINRLFNHLDMISFSIYEDGNNTEYIYMEMKVGKIKHSELRSVYNIIWEFNDLMYCTGMHTLNQRETILDYSAYFDEEGTEHKIWNTSVEIDEINNKFIWTISKNDLGLVAGDSLVKPWAQSILMTKNIDRIFVIQFAKDEIASGPDYVLKY